MKKITTLFPLIFLLFSIPSFAWEYQINEDDGVISGTVLDENTGETLIGANITTEDGSMGTSTDIDGRFQLYLPPGTYTIISSYIGYQDKAITDVHVSAGETQLLDVTMSDAAVELDIKVVVTAKAVKNTENSVLLLQKRSIKIQDGISSQEMSRISGGSAASALKRVSGASVAGKDVVIRGLSDRFVSGQLNGVNLPSTDPYKNTIPIDLIPTSLLDNIIVEKSFTADLPASSTSGNVNMQTRAFPEQFVVKVSGSLGYNTQSTFNNNFLTDQANDSKSWGFNDGSLDFPELLRDSTYITQLSTKSLNTSKARSSDSLATIVEEITNSMTHEFEPVKKRAPLNSSYGLSIENQFKMAGATVGFYAAGDFSHTMSHYEDNVVSNYFNPGSYPNRLRTNNILVDSKSDEKGAINGFGGVSVKFAPGHIVSFNGIYNHQGITSARYQNGEVPESNATYPDTFFTRTIKFTERELKIGILQGKHQFEGLGNLKADWSLSWVNSIQDEPNIRFFSNSWSDAAQNYFMDISSYTAPTQLFRYLDDNQKEAKLDFSLPVLQQLSKANKIQFGGFYLTKHRDFWERNLIVNDGSATQSFQGDIGEFFSDENMGWIGSEGGKNQIGLFMQDRTIVKNNHTGDMDISGGYVNTVFSLHQQVKMTAGVRLESTDIFVESLDEASEAGTIKEDDWCPSFGVIYSPAEKVNVRLNYGRTVARPNFREVAPFSSYDYEGGPFINGNPELDRSLIDNVDLRGEWFISPGELLAVSLYYKKIANPIELQFLPVGSQAQYRYVNLQDAEVRGLELEFRKHFGFISESMKDIRLVGNISLIQSIVPYTDEELALCESNSEECTDSRPFTNQSPFLANIGLNYQNADYGWDLTTSVNYFHDRLVFVGQSGNPGIYERGRAALDFVASKTIFNRLALKFKATNLLNPTRLFSSTYKDVEYIYESNTAGSEFGLGFTYTFK